MATKVKVEVQTASKPAPPAIAAPTKPRVKAGEMLPGDIFSETSRYTFIKKNADKKDLTPYVFENYATKEKVYFGKDYIEKYLAAANQFHDTIVVGKEDKLWTQKRIDEAVAAGTISKDVKLQPRVGDVWLPGIRSIWVNITTQVFAACYIKQGKEHSKKKYAELLEAQHVDAQAIMDRAKAAKKSLIEASKEAFSYIQDNPISKLEPGEERTLRGYKIQFDSETGFYDVIDMCLPADDSAGGIRRVNINTILWLVVDGVKYVVE